MTIEFLPSTSFVRFTCPEHGDVACYSREDNEAWCVDREEVLDLTEPVVQAAIVSAVSSDTCRCAPMGEACDICV